MTNRELEDYESRKLLKGVHYLWERERWELSEPIRRKGRMAPELWEEFWKLDDRCRQFREATRLGRVSDRTLEELRQLQCRHQALVSKFRHGYEGEILDRFRSQVVRTNEEPSSFEEIDQENVTSDLAATDPASENSQIEVFFEALSMMIPYERREQFFTPAFYDLRRDLDERALARQGRFGWLYTFCLCWQGGFIWAEAMWKAYKPMTSVVRFFVGIFKAGS